MLLIGSRAVKYRFPQDAREPNRDWDVLATFSEITKWVSENKEIITRHRLRGDGKKLFLHVRRHDCAEKHIFEIELVKPGSSSALFMEANQHEPTITAANLMFHVSKPTTLMLVKRSHIHQPIKWEKNINDYHFLKSHVEDTPTDLEYEAYLLRKNECDNRRDKKIKLGMTNDEFFGKSDASLNRHFEHDDLHLVTCYYDRPLYELTKPDITQAHIPEPNFNQLSHLNKIRMVREECFAIALERVVIPEWAKLNGLWPAEIKRYSVEGFNYALQRICTTLTKGYFRDFAIENYPEIKDNDRDYVSLFLTAIEQGKLRRKSA